MIELQKSLGEKTSGKFEEVDLSHPIVKEFAEALADDLNISEALSVVNPWVKQQHADPGEALGVWKQINSVLGIEDTGEVSEEDAATIEQAEAWCTEMNTARENKDWDTADAIRQKILDAGFKVQQTKEGATIQKQLA